MKELLGKEVVSLSVSKDQSVLSFETKDGRVAFSAYGDCCSESWFADINGVHSLLNATVRSIEEMPLTDYNVEDGRCRQESDSAYGYKIHTNKGSASVIFRNSSNGYYGGWLESIKDDLPQGDMVPITEDDWRA
jgi:hypothetical protein